MSMPPASVLNYQKPVAKSTTTPSPFLFLMPCCATIGLVASPALFCYICAQSNPNRHFTTTQMNWLDYRELPLSTGGFSELFFDYVYDFQEVKRFYNFNFRDSHSYEAAIQAVNRRTIDRTTLCQVLEEQNKAFGSSARTIDNIRLLQNPATFAVVTGQQVGLFGGPMYTVFKTITTIKMAERLKAKMPQFDFVPVFWIEGEDHDFPEMNHVSVLDAESKVVKIEYLPGGQMPERNLGPVGELVFEGVLDQTFASMSASLQKSEFTDPLLELLKKSYTAGRTFNQSFASWMNVLFEDYGLIFISSHDPRLKRLLSPMFIKEVTTFPQSSQIVIARSAELEVKYHAQIKAKSLNLFLLHKGGRFLIEPREHDFSLKGTRHFISKEELLRIATETPELLSPNVVLRPIAQDTLLPTVTYIAGPSEIAYHAQLMGVYEYFDVPQPVVYPRASGSFMEERVERTMEKYNMDLPALFEDLNSLTMRVLDQIAEVKLDSLFGTATKTVHDALSELKFGLREVDPTLLGALDSAKSKIDINIGVLKEKAIAAQKRRNETAVRQIERAVGTLLPNGNLQEREINVVYYMNKYGPDLVKWLVGELDVTGFKHQLLMI